MPVEDRVTRNAGYVRTIELNHVVTPQISEANANSFALAYRSYRYPQMGYSRVATNKDPELTSPHLKSSNWNVSLIGIWSDPIISLSVWCRSIKKKKMAITNQR